MIFICDWCHWEGSEQDAIRHPRHDYLVCPDCWAEGYDAQVREKRGSLMEVLAPPDPLPRHPKAMIDWTDEEWAINERTERFRLAHESAPVFVKTTVSNARQGGFDFMREEFRVAPRNRRKHP